MNLAKLLSLTAVAAIAAMALIGASAASAEPNNVVLCKNAELPCEPGNEWPNPTTIVAHATSPKLLTSVGTLECEKSLIELTLLNKLAKLILAHVLSLKFEGNCHLGSTACTTTVSETGGITFEHDVNPLEWRGRPVSLLLGETPMNTVINKKCGFLVNCTYTWGEETAATITNNAEGVATLTFNKAELKRSFGFCPATTEFDATYVGLGTGLWLES